MSIDAKIAEIMEESKLLGLVEEELDEDFITEEEYETLSEDEQALYELSKATLGSYVKKASGDKTNNAINVFGNATKNKEELAKRKTSLNKMLNRQRGIHRAVDRLTKEEFTLEDYSIDELEDFMMSEDFEQLDELDKNTVSKYLHKLQYKTADKVNPDGSLKQAGEKLSDKRTEMRKLAASKVGIIGNYPEAKVKAVPDWKRKADKLRKESIDVSADVDALMFGETLSEEFREKAATIFESAVVVRVKEEVARLEEEFEEKLAEQVDSITEGLVDKIDGYLDYVVEQWIEQNEIALESGIKSDIMESFITGMKGLFEEHYIDVPEEKYDVLSEMEAKIDALEEKLDEQVERNIDLKKSLSEATRKEIVKTISEGLTDTETEKFLALAEELTFDGADSFQNKVLTIRENYFNGNKTTRSVIQSVVTDSPVDELNEDTKYQNIDPTVAAYVKAINQFNK